ncbi:Glycoside hydrolase, family 71 [Penicillium roqueforti FM164]|uniref:Glycoside hydrolase, family 71 n=1 Tax=Penicillium roqueforti (strain FM164) TaxID=1365484 RepID=W6QR87_PENRF|nr:Glycoside hydrolase, family 71 [Penicillium roqueforti FM164]
MADEVFIVTILKSPATVYVQSSCEAKTYNAKAGIWSHSVPIGIGRQSFKVVCEGKTVNSLYRISRRDITNTYPYSIYNFNAYIGTLPAEASINRL